MEHFFMKLSAILSPNRLGKAIIDHERVRQCLENQTQLKDYLLFAAPLMLDRPSHGAYYGGPEAQSNGHSAQLALKKTALHRYWNSTVDAARLVVDYACYNSELPKMTCLIYK